MGCSVNPESASFLSLLPGCCFYPSEEQLLCYYLPKKNRSPGLGDEGGSSSISISVSDAGFHVIKDVNLYDYDPFDLPGAACFSHGYGGRKRHWYCYAPEMKGSRRKAGAGFWKRFGRVRVVMGRGGKVALGTRKSFVFHTGNASNSKTDWVMHEYALTGQSKLGLRENAGDGVSFNDASQEDYIELDDLVEPLIGVD